MTCGYLNTPNLGKSAHKAHNETVFNLASLMHIDIINLF